MMTDEHLAKEAQRLLHDEVLLKAVSDVQNDALRALAVADVDNKTELLRLQANVIVLSDVMTKLAEYVVRYAPPAEEDEGSPVA